MNITVGKKHKYKIGDFPSGNKSWKIAEFFTENGVKKARCERVVNWRTDTSRSSHNFR